MFFFVCFFLCYGDHRDLHVLTHSFPTRRSSDLHLFQVDLHNRLGVWGLPFYLMIALTGAFMGLAAVFYSGYAAVLYQGNRPAVYDRGHAARPTRSEEHTSELQSLMRISYAVFCLKKKKNKNK